MSYSFKNIALHLSFQQGSESLDTGILHNVMEYMTTTVWTIISDAHSKKYSSL